MTPAAKDYIQLTPEGLRAIFPRSPLVYLEHLFKGSVFLDNAGITASRARLSFCFSNVEHESGCFTIPNLTESTAYSRARAKVVWPSRKAQIDALPGVGLQFEKALMNAMYGGRMGNRPGTDDGYRYIGRGACQHTGRDGYAEMERRTGLPLVEHPELAGLPEHQPRLIAAFIEWKGLNALADQGNFRGYVKIWNGGNIGQADREALLAGNNPVIARLNVAERMIGDSVILPARPVSNVLLAVQTKLKALGFDPGPLDGLPGPKTKAAVVQFQKSKGLDPDGIIGPKTKAALAI